MRMAMILIVAGLAMASAQKGGPSNVPTVAVVIRGDTNSADFNLCWAKAMASRIFAQANVRVSWQVNSSNASVRQSPIVVSLTAHSGGVASSNAFGYAQVFEGVHINIFLDRVVRASREPSLASALLAHVMVHEITHMLERTDGHSREGIMKAGWTHKEIERMLVKPLTFTQGDIDLIHLGLSSASSDKRVLAATTNDGD